MVVSAIENVLQAKTTNVWFELQELFFVTSQEMLVSSSDQ
jgi:hypothetical protein